MKVYFLLPFLVKVFAISNWYTRDDYNKLKRSVNWIPFRPEEHPMKSYSSEWIELMLLGHRVNDEFKAIQINKTKIDYIPSFLLAPPSEFYIDQEYPKCKKDPIDYGVCSRSDIWAITRTLSWSDCARNIRDIPYSAKNLIQCDKLSFGNSCIKSLNHLNLMSYSDSNILDLGFIPESCNPSSDLSNGKTTCLKECISKCADGSIYQPIKINKITYIWSQTDLYNNLNNGIGVFVSFNANKDIINYKGGIYNPEGELIFFGRILGYKTYRDVYERVSYLVELGYGKNWGENGNIWISDKGNRLLSTLSSSR